jgi:hypothetical protein
MQSEWLMGGSILVHLSSGGVNLGRETAALQRFTKAMARIEGNVPGVRELSTFNF